MGDNIVFLKVMHTDVFAVDLGFISFGLIGIDM